MNILIIHNSYTHFGGEDQAVLQQKELLESRGHNVYVYGRDNKETGSYRLHGKVRLVLSSFQSKKTDRDINDIMLRFKPDIAHVHNVYPLISPVVYQILHKNNVPVVQTVHNYRFICPNGLMFNRDKVCTLCPDRKNRFFCAANRCYRNSFTESLWYALILSRAHQAGTFKFIDRFIVLNDFIKDLMVNAGFDSDKFSTVPNFTADRGQYLTNIKENYIVYIGRLSREKGIMTLLEAVKIFVGKSNVKWRNAGLDDTGLKGTDLKSMKLNSMKLKIIGHGDLLDTVTKFINENDLNDNIELLGFMSGVEKDKIIAKAKAVVVPSTCYEAFSLAAIEAFSAGTTVVASNIGGLKYVITDNYNGLLVKPGDITDLSLKLEYITNDGRNTLSMSQNAYSTYLSKYSPDIYYRSILELYSELIKSN